MDCSGSEKKGGKQGDGKECETNPNVGQVSSVEGLEFGTGIPKELLEGPGPEFPESDQALLNNVAATFVLQLFEDSAEAVELGLVSPQNFLENQVSEDDSSFDSKSPRSSVATLVEDVKADGTSDNSWSTEDDGKDLHGILLEKEKLPAVAEENGNPIGEVPNDELAPLEKVAAKSNAVGLSGTELLGPLEDQMPIAGGTVTMVKSILKTSMSTRFRQPFLETYFYRGGRGLARILKDKTTMDALDFKDFDRMMQPRCPWTEKWLKFREDNTNRIRSQLKMSPSWAKPAPLELGPSCKAGPPIAGSDLILEHEQVHETAASEESQEIVAQVPMPIGEEGTEPMEPVLSQVRMRKDWEKLRRGRNSQSMSRTIMEVKNWKLTRPISPPRPLPMLFPVTNNDKRHMDQIALFKRNCQILRESRLKSKGSQPSFKCYVPILDYDDDYRTLPRYYMNETQQEERKIMAKSAEAENKESKKKLGFFQKMVTKKGARSSERIRRKTIPAKDFQGESKVKADITVCKKNDSLNGNMAEVEDLPKKIENEGIEEPSLTVTPNNSGLDNSGLATSTPSHSSTPPSPGHKRPSRFRRFVDFLLCRSYRRRNKNEASTPISNQSECPTNSKGNQLVE